MEVYRTQDAAFEQLPDFPWEPAYADVADPDGGTLRMAYVDAGPADGPVALLLHGEPSWSFLYRHVVRVLTENEIRCVAPDMVGFGRSDKPLQQADYSYAQLVEWTRELVFDLLDLREVTLVGQDWGGLIGLRLVAEQPERFARVVAANTGLPTGQSSLGQQFQEWRRFSLQGLPTGPLVVDEPPGPPSHFSSMPVEAAHKGVVFDRWIDAVRDHPELVRKCLGDNGGLPSHAAFRALNRAAFAQMTAERKLEVVPGATHLFEEPGTLEEVARLAANWFVKHLRPPIRLG